MDAGAPENFWFESSLIPTSRQNKARYGAPSVRDKERVPPGLAHLGIYAVDQSLNVAVAKCICLEFSWVAGMSWHVVRQKAAGVARVSKDAHDLEQIEHAFVWIDLGKVVEPTLDRPHVNLMDLAAAREVLHQRRNLLVGVC